MINTNCEICGGQFPTNDTFKITGKVLCTACANEIATNSKNISPEQIRRQTDPTICVNCETDNGQTNWPVLAGCPVCPKCENFFRNRPFPRWIKAAFAAVVILVILSLVNNMRFIQAYCELRMSRTASSIEKAASLASSAADRVPESTQLRAIASFYKGVVLLNQDKSAEALKVLNSCKDSIPPKWGINELITQADIGVAFDNHDYDRFLALALKEGSDHNDNPMYSGQIASAYACKYAVTGNEEFKQKAMNALDKARTSHGNNQTFAEYEDRILHRLHTREIIDHKQFKERFPNGWKQQGKE